MSRRTEAVPVTGAVELVDLLTTAQRMLARGLAALFEEEQATVEQWRILRALSVDQGRSMGELAVALEIPHPTLTRLVDGLVDSAHLYRTQSSRDRRRISVHLSARGEELLGRLNSFAAAHEEALRLRHGGDVVEDLKRALDALRA